MYEKYKCINVKLRVANGKSAERKSKFMFFFSLAFLSPANSYTYHFALLYIYFSSLVLSFIPLFLYVIVAAASALLGFFIFHFFYINLKLILFSMCA